MQPFAHAFEHLVGRLDGPMHFRFIVQPLMAIVFAIRDGRRDAHDGRPPFRIVTEPGKRREVMLTASKSVGKIFVIALILDAVYQLGELGWFYPGEALFTAIILAIVPYVLVKGPVNYLTSSRSPKPTGR